MPFKNRVRLPFHLNKPQYPETRTVYRRADGKTVVQSVIIRKEYQGSTDYWPEGIHEKFKIALAHDTTTVEADIYIGDISQDGDYTINWPEGNYPAAPATFKAEVTPFSATNSNCQTCEDANQVNLGDDVYPFPLLEGSTNNTFPSYGNDTVCCWPATFSIIYYNTDVVANATIDSSLVVHIDLKSPIKSYTHLKIATYRVTCPNGGYDEADVYADITGSLADPCLAPTDLGAFIILNDGATMEWTAPASPPALGYHWQLFRADNPGSPFLEGDEPTTAHLFSPLLDPGTDYIFYVASKCAADVLSNYAEVDFTTTGSSGGGGGGGNCGRYSVFYGNPVFPYQNSHVTYINCAGVMQSDVLINGIARQICALENSPGNPESIVVEGEDPRYHDYAYIEPC